LQAPSAITKVTYADGKSCSDQPSATLTAAYAKLGEKTRKLPGKRARQVFDQFLARHRLTQAALFNALQPRCKPVGWQAPKLPRLTSADVSSPIRVKLLTAIRFCVRASQTRGFNGAVACDRRVPVGDSFLYGAGPGRRATLVTVSFIARQTVTSDNSAYQIFVKAPGNNGGGGSGTQSNLRAGQRVTLSWFVGQHVTGVYRGTIVFIQDTGAGGLQQSPFEYSRKRQLVVGHFSFRYRMR
jgi:hypothetical protein